MGSRDRGLGGARGREVASAAGSGAAAAAASKAGRAARVRGGGGARRPPPELAALGRSLGVPGAAGAGGAEAAAGGRAGARRRRGGIDAAGEERGRGGGAVGRSGAAGLCESLRGPGVPEGGGAAPLPAPSISGGAAAPGCAGKASPVRGRRRGGGAAPPEGGQEERSSQTERVCPFGRKRKSRCEVTAEGDAADVGEGAAGQGRRGPAGRCGEPAAGKGGQVPGFVLCLVTVPKPGSFGVPLLVVGGCQWMHFAVIKLNLKSRRFKPYLGEVFEHRLSGWKISALN